MNDRSFDLFYLVVLLVLPISALAARQIPMRETFKMALAWVAIFGILFVLVEAWQQAFGVGAGLGGFFGG